MNTAEADLASRGNMPRNAPSRARKKNSLQPLLSNERSQKFDLLVHLISNIPDGIVICGPKGIGKSTMLDLLQAAKPENWLLCRISATNSTGFDDIMTTLANSFGANGGKPHPQSPDDCLDLKLKQIRRSDQILVLLLDDAGEMAPGVISVVCQYAVSNPALRPVFTMTADRLHLTLSSDPAIAGCQVIEIPPLSESQCGEFLKNLSGKPGALISFRAVRPALVQYVYRQSHGVPGNVLAILPELSREPFFTRHPPSLAILALITLIAALCTGIWLWKPADNVEGQSRVSPTFEKTKPDGAESSRPIPRPAPRPVPIPPQAQHEPGKILEAPETETAAAARPQQTVIGKISGPETDSAVLPRIANPVQPNGPPKPQTSGPSPTTDPAFVAAIPSDLSIGPNPDRSKTGFQDEPEDEQSNGQGNRAEPVNTQKDAESQEAVSRVSEPLVAPLIEDVVQTTPRASETPSEAPNSTSFEGVPGSRWIRAQDPGHFTLQILATVKPEALKQFLKTNPKLGGLAVFTMNRNGTTWYALIKGVYPSLDQAKQAARNLPGGLQKAWPRTFRSVHQAMIESDSE